MTRGIEASDPNRLADRLALLKINSCTCPTITGNHPAQCPTAVIDDVCAFLRAAVPSPLAEALEVIRPFADGEIDVSEAAVILGHPEAEEALAAARSFLAKHGGKNDE